MLSWTLGKNFGEKIVDVWKEDTIAYSLFVDGHDQVKQDMQLLANCFEELVLPFSSSKIQSKELFRNVTLLHGDFHAANTFLEKDDEGVTKSIRLCDWQAYGYGHAATELAYFLCMSVKYDPAVDEKIKRAYYEELTRDTGRGPNVSQEEYPYTIFEREVAARTLGMATTFGSMLALDTPEKREKRTQRNRKMLYVDEALGPKMGNLFVRSFVMLKDPKIKSFILGENKDE
jgi:hypothetical protein